MSSIARCVELFAVSLRLGLTSFGGPVAHLGYFRAEYVARRRWLDEAEYADLVALCQFLPGPASSQVGFGIGLQRAGLAGGLCAFLGFTLPSVLLLIAFALGLEVLGGGQAEGYLRGMKVAAVAVVTHAVWGMGKKLCPEIRSQSIALITAAVLVWMADARLQIGLIVLGALIGWRLLPAEAVEAGVRPPSRAQPRHHLGLLLFGLGLVGLPLLAGLGPWWQSLDSYFRSGALVFGGGHVVLPLLEQEFVPQAVSAETFLAGYGAAQAVPGPLFTFASFLGASSQLGTTGWVGGLWATFGIFLPSFLLLYGVLPHWQRLRHRQGVQRALRGTNAVVVGLLLAALYQPVFRAGIRAAPDLSLALVCFAALQVWRWPSWLVVSGAALAAGLVIS